MPSAGGLEINQVFMLPEYTQKAYKLLEKNVLLKLDSFWVYGPQSRKKSNQERNKLGKTCQGKLS